jgi:hypothetical protein
MIVLNGYELSNREEELYTGNCPPDRPCTPQQIAKFRAFFDATKVPSCVHLGGETGKQLCETCQGRVWVKRFACDLHGQCTPQKALDGIACCQTCMDYKSST